MKQQAPPNKMQASAATPAAPQAAPSPPGTHVIVSKPAPAKPAIMFQQPAPPVHTIVSVPPHAPGTLSGFLYDWQGLEAGGLAILAAVIGGLFIRRQTNQTGQHKIEEDGRRLRAARTAMPLTLSSLDDYAEQSASYLAHHYGMTRVHGGGGPVPTDMPTIPADAISSLERLVQAGSDALSECVSDLLGDLQVFAARMRSLARTGTSKPVRPLAAADARTYVIDNGVVAARIAVLYDYGRRKIDAVPETPSWDDVWKALKLEGCDEDLNPDLHAMVMARKKRGVPVGHMDKDYTLDN